MLAHWDAICTFRHRYHHAQKHVARGCLHHLLVTVFCRCCWIRIGSRTLSKRFKSICYLYVFSKVPRMLWFLESIRVCGISQNVFVVLKLTRTVKNKAVQGSSYVFAISHNDVMFSYVINQLLCSVSHKLTKPH